MNAWLLAPLLLAAQPQQPQQPPLSQGGYAAPGGDASLSCEQLAAELMVAAGGVMRGAGEQLRIAQAQQPDMGGSAIANQLVGGAAAGLPNIVGSIIGMAENARMAERQREADAAAAREQVLVVEQEVRLDRLERLHQLHEQRCAENR